MKLTPIDIQQQQFRKTLRGYDVSEVEGFLELMGEQLQELSREATELRSDLGRCEREVEEHRDREVTLREAMLTAQRAIDEIREQAQKEAQLIVSEAELRAEKILHNANSRVGRVSEEIGELRRQRARVIEEVRGVLNLHQKLLDVHEDEADKEAQSADASVTVLERVRIPSPPVSEESDPSVKMQR
jgi:cell division initiation protein